MTFIDGARVTKRRNRLFLYLLNTFAVEVHQAETTLAHRIALYTQFIE